MEAMRRYVLGMLLLSLFLPRSASGGESRVWGRVYDPDSVTNPRPVLVAIPWVHVAIEHPGEGGASFWAISDAAGFFPAASPQEILRLDLGEKDLAEGSRAWILNGAPVVRIRGESDAFFTYPPASHAFNQVNAFYHTNALLRFIDGLLPEAYTFDRLVRLRVGLGTQSHCGYDRLRERGDCVIGIGAGRLTDVIAHEAFHAIQGHIAATAPDHPSLTGITVFTTEGLADYFTAAYTGDGVIFNENCEERIEDPWYCRHLENDRALSTYNRAEPHLLSTILSGALYTLRLRHTEAKVNPIDRIVLYALLHHRPEGKNAWSDLDDFRETLLSGAATLYPADPGLAQEIDEEFSRRDIHPYAEPVVFAKGGGSQGCLDLDPWDTAARPVVLGPWNKRGLRTTQCRIDWFEGEHRIHTDRVLPFGYATHRFDTPGEKGVEITCIDVTGHRASSTRVTFEMPHPLGCPVE